MTSEVMDAERLICVRCYEIPFHALPSNFFAVLTKPFGVFMNSDENIEKKIAMDMARFLVRIGGKEVISRVLVSNVNGGGL